jgi:hypothetical protein
MSEVDSQDIGSGYSIRFFTCEELGDEPIGLIVTGPAAPQCKWPSDGRCGGSVHFQNAPGKYRRKPDGSFRPAWTVVSQNPLTLKPSIQCACQGQHGHIKNGRYENAGGIVEEDK